MALQSRRLRRLAKDEIGAAFPAHAHSRLRAIAAFLGWWPTDPPVFFATAVDPVRFASAPCMLLREDRNHPF